MQSNPAVIVVPLPSGTPAPAAPSCPSPRRKGDACSVHPRGSGSVFRWKAMFRSPHPGFHSGNIPPEARLYRFPNLIVSLSGRRCRTTLSRSFDEARDNSLWRYVAVKGVSSFQKNQIDTV